jgi:AAA15 family ATPase/GTPase
MMIKTIEINNFKSIEHIKFNCKKVNIFIGEPNTGKSNILEIIAIQGIPLVDLDKTIRFEDKSDLFCDKNIKKPIQLITDIFELKIELKNEGFRATSFEKKTNMFFEDYIPTVYYYKFESLKSFPGKLGGYLRPPHGENLLEIIQTNKSLRNLVTNLFEEYGLELVVKPYANENKIEIQKKLDNLVISFPYSLISDTLQRVIFYLAAIETNKESVNIFEEPEAHTFPYYTKLIAERIAMDETNQYFLNTHNPYMLLSLVEKTKMKDIAVFVTYLEDYKTKVKAVPKIKLGELLDLESSVFFNLEKFLER